MKIWEEMDKSEKLDFLRTELEAMGNALRQLQSSTSGAVLGLNQRMKALEDKAKT